MVGSALVLIASAGGVAAVSWVNRPYPEAVQHPTPSTEGIDKQESISGMDAPGRRRLDLLRRRDRPNP
jgi:hypothetical protein